MVEVLINASSRALANITSKYYALDGLNYNSFKTIYDALVLPVMNYAAATWGHTAFQKCSTVQNRAMRTILGVGRVTPIAAMYGDLGWTPPHVRQKLEVVKFWLRLCKIPNNRTVKKVFDYDHQLSRSGRQHQGHTVKCMFEQAGLSVWENQNTDELSDKSILRLIEDSEMRLFHQSQRLEMQDMSRLLIYNQIKNDFKLEQYVTNIDNRKLRGLLARARMGTLPISVETGRYRGIPRDERLCMMCDDRVVEDEPHLLLHCSKYDDLREMFYSKILNDTDHGQLSNHELLTLILANDHKMSLSAKYILDLLMRRSAS